MAYVADLVVTNATSTGLIVAAPTSNPDAATSKLHVRDHGIAQDCVVSGGGTLQTIWSTCNGVINHNHQLSWWYAPAL